MTRRHLAAGVSALEALVAATITGVVVNVGLVLAVALVRDVESDVGAKPAAAAEQRVALDRIEAEVRQAAIVLEPATGTGRRLVLTLRSGETVTWSLEGTNLRRSVTARDGAARTRVALADVDACAFDRDGRLVRVIIQREGSPASQRAAVARNLGSAP